jgi:putative CocE/NonD family hydrolase
MTAVSQDWHELISQPVHSDRVNDYDVVIPMRDGIKLTADVHRPKTDESVPALLAFQPWGKDHEALGLRFPQQRRPNTLWDGSIEGGDTQYFVSRGYAHIVVDARGTGAAEGELAGIMGTGPGGEGRDIHDVIEWLAEQPWCDGNVGMVGISYLAAVQLLAAAQHPPHLKAIFPEGGHYDTYGHCYHGGILWMMPRAALRGRGGDSGLAVAHPRSFTRDAVGEETFQELLAQRLEDPDVAFHPNYHQLLKYPDIDPIWLDYILQCYDGEFWWGEGAPDDRFAKVEIPVHLGVQLGRGWQVDETIAAFQGFR